MTQTHVICHKKKKKNKGFNTRFKTNNVTVLDLCPHLFGPHSMSVLTRIPEIKRISASVMRT